jgi:hypothetical protein
MSQIARVYDGEEAAAKVPTEWKQLVDAFPQYLAKSTQERPLVLFLDSLDQLLDSNNAWQCGWLPTAWPAAPHTKVVLSTLPDDTLDGGAAGGAADGASAGAIAGGVAGAGAEAVAGAEAGAEAGASGGAGGETPLAYGILDKLRARMAGSPQQFVEVNPMVRADGARIVARWLAEEGGGRRLQPAQEEAVLSAMEGCRGGAFPLFLKIAFEVRGTEAAVHETERQSYIESRKLRGWCLETVVR